MRKYNFAREYSPYPGPRTENIGPFSGARFKKEVLDPQFASNVPIEIDVSGIRLSFGPSFMSEAFGKCAEQYTKKRLFEIVRVPENDDPRNKRFKELLKEYADRATKK